MAKIKVFGLFVEMELLVFADFPYSSLFLLGLTTGPMKMANINVLCLYLHIDSDQYV